MNALNFVGEATVANTKQTNSSEIFVYSPLLFPTAEGGINADVARVQKKAVDANGNAVSTDVLKSNKTVPATWKPIGEPSRLTPPDVLEGSKVALYQFTGSSDYYWTTFGFGGDTMRLETIVYGWNAMPNRGENSDYDLSKYYTMTIDTRSGSIGLRNSSANGEKSIIDATFNYMEGRFVMAGSHESLLVWDDVDHSFTYHNKDESILTVNKDQIYLFSKGGITLQTDETIIAKSKNVLVEAEDVMITVANETIINSPETTHNGNLTVKGSINADLGIISKTTVQGMQGVKTGTVDVDKHVHTNGNDGNNTGVPIAGL